MSGSADELSGEDLLSLCATSIDITATIDSVRDPTAGAVSTFIGTTRDTFEDKRVVSLEYEAYTDMALVEMKQLCAKIREQWDVKKIAIAHKIGSCPIGEASVVIAVSSAHRREAVEGAHFAIDELKRTVPIWKKEIYEGHDPKWKSNAEQPPSVEN
ncbi:unnamed protein product [Ectocarpus fasciculatus]